MDDEDQTRGKAVMSDRRAASGLVPDPSVKKDGERERGEKGGVEAGRGRRVMNDGRVREGWIDRQGQSSGSSGV